LARRGFGLDLPFPSPLFSRLNMEYVINYSLYFIAIVAVATPVIGFGIFAPGVATITIVAFIVNWFSQFFQTGRSDQFFKENEANPILKFVKGDAEHKEEHASSAMWVEDSEEEVHEEHHVIPIKVYGLVLGFLFVMTVITVAVAQVDLGKLNMIIAMAVASIKAFFVLAYFMHLKYDNMLNRVIFLSAFGFLLLLFAFSMGDIVSRIAPEAQFETQKFY